jgi:hypothetical protein
MNEYFGAIFNNRQLMLREPAGVTFITGSQDIMMNGLMQVRSEYLYWK